MIEVDLIDDSGPNIVSIAQADPDVWATLAVQAGQLAAQRGLSLDTGPLNNPAERTLSSIGDVQNWIASQSSVGGARRPVASAVDQDSAPDTHAFGGLVVGTVVGALLAGTIGSLAGGALGWWFGGKLKASP